jgi:hypothetical protein
MMTGKRLLPSALLLQLASGLRTSNGGDSVMFDIFVETNEMLNSREGPTGKVGGGPPPHNETARCDLGSAS